MLSPCVLLCILALNLERRPSNGRKFSLAQWGLRVEMDSGSTNPHVVNQDRATQNHCNSQIIDDPRASVFTICFGDSQSALTRLETFPLFEGSQIIYRML